MDAFWKETHQALLQDKEVVVAVIVGHSGSTPRTSGTKMLVHRDGKVTGTIGGGFTEADVIRSAGTLFVEQCSVLKEYNLNTGPGAGDMDLICGGRMQVLLEYIVADETVNELYRLLDEAAETGRSGLLIGKFHQGAATDQFMVERALYLDNELQVGTLQPPAILASLEQASGDQSANVIEAEDGWYVLEAIIPPKTVYLIGAGHVAKEIAPLAHKASFRTIVIDDRDAFADTSRFPLADKVAVCADCSRPLAGFVVDENSYIIIITRGHRFDKEALGQALSTRAAYIGMIGSRSKRSQVYAALQAEGWSPERLQQVHCPIGLSIGAKTPFEIAVSVIAEIIRHRAGL